MNVQRLSTWRDAASLRDDWNRLANGVPFRRWEWLGTWWEHYGAGHEWFVLAIRDDAGQLRGIAPWFIETIPAFGRVIQFLGTGQACSDYLSILCAAEDRELVATAVAAWLMDAGLSDKDAWDMITLDGLAADDPDITRLVESLEKHGCSFHRQEASNTWYVPLPTTWDEYRRRLSKPNRRHVRVLQERLIDTGMVTIRTVDSRGEFDQVWPMFVDLHQRRQQSIGKSGCFASDTFKSFVHQAAREFLSLGKLELMWVERERKPMAAQLAFVDGGVKYAYQVGIDPETLADSPGWLVHTQSIKRAIESGATGFDFLRGDEQHKHRMGAEPRAMTILRIVPPRLGPIMLHKAWITGNTVKNWIKAGLHKTGMR